MISGGMSLDPAESTHTTKVSESEYSTSGNSRSQWSCSARSCLSTSSGYGTRGQTKPDVGHRLIRRIKDKNRKKKKLKCSTASIVTGSSLGENESLSTSQTNSSDQTSGVQQTEPSASTSTQQDAIDNKGETPTSMDSNTLKKPARWTTPSPLDTMFETPEPWDSVDEQLRSAASKPEADDGFCCIVSMQDGAVLFTTPNITHSLGFPRDMWLGRSFIDFVHPRDRATFADQITSNAVISLGDTSSRSSQKDQTNFLYVMLRKYRGLRNTGFGITKSTVGYQPYRLTLMFRQAPTEGSELPSKNTPNIILVVSATPVCSIYNVPNELLDNKELRFTTRHTIGGILKYVDGNSVKSIGYLPQDILGRSILELYHPEDVSIFKKACESAITKGQITGSWVSQPSRFLTNNGCYILLQTEWVSFINPWTKEIEFIIGNHHVLRGPSNPDIFAANCSDQTSDSFSEELLKEAKSIEEQIVQLLKKPITESSNEKKRILSKQCKTLTAYMEELITEMATSKVKHNLPGDSDFTSSRRDSMIIGEMSPHHEVLDNKTISESLLSYNQLNYNDNIQRFFDSCPAINVSDSLKPNSSIDVSLNVGKTNTNRNRNALPGIFQHPALTEELLYKHNEDMQKVMLKKHRDAQVLARDVSAKDNSGKASAAVENHGIKRGPSFSWEQDTPKCVKHQHGTNSKPDGTHLTVPAICTSTDPRDIILTTTAAMHNQQVSSSSRVLSHVSEVWSPFAVSVTNMQAIQSTALSSFIQEKNLHSVVPQINPNNPTPVHPIAFPLMTGVMCPQLQAHQHCVFYHPMLMCQAMPYQSIPTPRALVTDHHNQSRFNTAKQSTTVSTAVQVDDTTHPLGPGGRCSVPLATTSAPVCDSREPIQDSNFNRGSIAPALRFERALVFNVGGGFQLEKEPISCKNCDPSPALQETNDDMDISSLSSFYSSFLKSENSSDSDDPTKRTSNCANWESASRVKRRPNPPWLDNVSKTKDLLYRYQLDERSVRDLLESDLIALKSLHQPLLVNEQLDQLYLDLEGEGLTTRLALSETASGGTSSSCSDDGESSQCQSKFTGGSIKYSKLMMIYEENAPFPSPLPISNTDKL